MADLLAEALQYQVPSLAARQLSQKVCGEADFGSLPLDEGKQGLQRAENNGRERDPRPCALLGNAYLRSHWNLAGFPCALHKPLSVGPSHRTTRHGFKTIMGLSRSQIYR